MVAMTATRRGGTRLMTTTGMTSLDFSFENPGKQRGLNILAHMGSVPDLSQSVSQLHSKGAC